MFCYFRLFTKYPETKSGFPSLAGLANAAVLSSPATVVQAENLRKGLDTIVSNIGNDGGLELYCQQTHITWSLSRLLQDNIECKLMSTFVR